MTRLFRRLGVAAAFLLTAAFPALAADNYRIIDGAGQQRIMAASDIGSVLYPRQLIQGLSGGVPTSVQMTTPGALNVNCVAGCSGGGGGGGVVTNAGVFAVQVTTPIPAGSNTIGAVTLSGTLPAFASTPTFNLGTLNGAATSALQSSVQGTFGAITAQRQVLYDATGNPVSFSDPVPLVGVNGTTIATLANSVPTSGGGTLGATAPTTATYAGANSGGNLVGIIQGDASVKIDVATATTTQLVPLSSGKKIYVTLWDVIAAGTTNFKLVYGTGTNCGTGTTDLTGSYPLTAQAGIAKGAGLGPALVVPASQALCAVNSAAIQASGSLTYTQF